MPINGCYIVVVEGPDKVGKATQSKLLAQKLPKHFTKTFQGRSHRPQVPIKVEMEEIPYNDGKTGTYQKIYQMLKTGEALRFPEAFQTLQSANRMVFQADLLPTLTKYHDVLILDRWNTSGWAYGRASGCTDDMLDCVMRDIVRPDMVFLFEGEPFDRKDQKDDCYEENTDFMSRVRAGYKQWGIENMDIAIPVKADRPVDEVHEELIHHCGKRLSFK